MVSCIFHCLVYVMKRVRSEGKVESLGNNVPASYRITGRRMERERTRRVTEVCLLFIEKLRNSRSLEQKSKWCCGL